MGTAVSANPVRLPLLMLPLVECWKMRVSQFMKRRETVVTYISTHDKKGNQ